MIVRNFVKRSLDNKKKLFIILLTASVVSGLSALVLNIFGESTVYRGEHYIELNPDRLQTLSINTAGMPVEIGIWDGDGIKVTAVAELPLIIRSADEEGEFLPEISISQDDGFAISLFTPDLFRYSMKVYLPRMAEFKEINVTAVSGNVYINSHYINAERVNVDTKSGRVTVNRVTCVYIINTGSGNVFMDFDFFDYLAVIETVSGNIEVRIPDYAAGNLQRKLRANSQKGQVRIIEKDSSLPENFPRL
jgi:hypothetical protein